MTDLRLKYGDQYYKDIRKKRVTPAEGTIQNLTAKQKKALSKKGHQARWKGKDNVVEQNDTSTED